jgi:type III secretion protein J
MLGWGLRLEIAIAAVCVALCACKTAVRGGLAEREANQLIAALDGAAISASKVAQNGARDRYQVEVPASDAARAIALLEAQRLPKPDEPGIDALYANSSWLATPQEERARWAAATAAELARSLERMQGVLDARVHITPADTERALDAPLPEPKAAVLLRHARSAQAIDESAVRALIAGAVDGLSAERVTVVQVSASAPERTAPALVHVGPIAVSRDSAATLRLLLAVALGLDLLMAIALVILVSRARATRQVATGTEA